MQYYSFCFYCVVNTPLDLYYYSYEDVLRCDLSVKVEDSIFLWTTAVPNSSYVSTSDSLSCMSGADEISIEQLSE